jgi:hypothetical protein
MPRHAMEPQAPAQETGREQSPAPSLIRNKLQKFRKAALVLVTYRTLPVGFHPLRILRAKRLVHMLL